MLCEQQVQGLLSPVMDDLKLHDTLCELLELEAIYGGVIESTSSYLTYTVEHLSEELIEEINLLLEEYEGEVFGMKEGSFMAAYIQYRD